MNKINIPTVIDITGSSKDRNGQQSNAEKRFKIELHFKMALLRGDSAAFSLKFSRAQKGQGGTRLV